MQRYAKWNKVTTPNRMYQGDHEISNILEWVTDLNDEQYLEGFQIRWFKIQGIYAAFLISILDNAIY